MTKEENIRAILESNFEGYKEEIINIAVKRICELDKKEKVKHWAGVDGPNAICGYCNRLNLVFGSYCKHCGVRMEEIK